MDYQDTLLMVNSKDGKGTDLNYLTYNLFMIKQMKKDYDLQIGLRSLRISDIRFEIVAGYNVIDWQEIRYATSEIRNCTATLTAGFYTKEALITELELQMKNNSQHLITYFVTFTIENRIVITSNKAPGDKQFSITNPDEFSGWNVLGFDIGNTDFETVHTADERSFYDQKLRININTNLIASNNYSTCENNTTNEILCSLIVTSDNVDNYDFYDNSPVMFESSCLNSSSFYIKFYNCHTRKLQEFTNGTSYEMTFMIRQKYKAALIRKSMMITKGEIVAIVQELLKEKAKNNKTTVEKKLKEKKPELPNKKK